MKILYKGIFIACAFLLCISFTSCEEATGNSETTEKEYLSFEDDPMATRIYTLENGLKVYLSVNEEAPRVNTAIAVRAGSKNDPADATGLAHYLEHMLFKGTGKYGTLDFEKEEPLLHKIDSLYEVYRNTEGDSERKEIYARIDSISQIASTYAIANEYDKLVSGMGAKGTNAYTSNERTVYINDIPTNQLDKWLTVEAERFSDPQMRLFHTELEAVYEEKNRTLDSDFRKAWYALYENLFPNHQYGQQSTIGTIEHLKNPSITEIKKYFDKYYVPNNMAIVLAGDFDPDEVIAKIKDSFGKMEASEEPVFSVKEEQPIVEPIQVDLKGPESEFVYIAFRFPGRHSDEIPVLRMTDMMLDNGTAGLINLNINQQQKTLEAGCSPRVMTDYSVHLLRGEPKEGQSLEEVKDLLLAQIDSLKAGNFPDWLPSAAVNDLELNTIKRMDQNRGRTSMMINAFIQEIPWEEQIHEFDELRKVTKEDIVKFANEHYKDNYVVVYKRTGEEESLQKVEKPEITPIETNRGKASEYLTKISEMEVEDIQPVFLDYENDIHKSELENGIKIRSIKNDRNELFYMYYVFDMGKNNDKKMNLAVDYLPFLGTSKYSPTELKQEFYKIGCEFNVSAGNERIYVSMSGLNKNFEKGLKLFEHLLADAQPEEEALTNLVSDKMKTRENRKLSKGEILYGAMYNYAVYGENSPYTDNLTKAEMDALQPAALAEKIHGLTSYKHHILYYGPKTNEELADVLKEYHKTPETLKEVPASAEYVQQENEGTKVYVINYDMKQAEILMLSKGEAYNPETTALATVFNEYFGGGMGSIVFQEMRESKALAYSVFSSFRSPSDSAKAHYVLAYIGTQADKLPEAMAGMTDLMNNMPESDKNFDLAKKAAMEKISTERITKSSILWNYETALKRGVDHDLRQDTYKAIPEMSMEDLKAFYNEMIQNREYNIMVIGKKEDLDMNALAEYGKVQELTLEQVFGY